MRHKSLVVSVLAVFAALIALNKSTRKVAHDMGVVADTLNAVSTQLDKVKGEFLGKLDDLQRQLDAKGALDAADTQALADLKLKANELDGIVDDAVTTPLPDPVTPPTDTTDPEVIDPEVPVSEVPPTTETPVTETPAEPVTPVDETPVTDPATPEAPVTETPAEPNVPDAAAPAEGSPAEAIAAGEPIPAPGSEEVPPSSTA